MFWGRVLYLIKIFIILLIFLTNITSSFAKEASMDFTIDLPEYLQIQTVTSPVLIANITDKTGNLYSPLSSRFKVISNSRDGKTLYLNGQVLTENGYEDALFNRGSRVYLAFANIANRPKTESLANCKYGARAQESPGIVAYPITSILGTKTQYVPAKARYEVYIQNGTTDITVNVGSHILKNSFASNDPRGFYQATLSLTESEL